MYVNLRGKLTLIAGEVRSTVDTPVVELQLSSSVLVDSSVSIIYMHECMCSQNHFTCT